MFGGKNNTEVYEQWDIFGPLFYALLMAITVFFAHNLKGADYIIPTIIIFMFLGGAMVGLNSILIGGSMSVMGAMCLLGYSTAPLAFGALAICIVNLFNIVTWVQRIIVLAVSIPLAVWSMFATYGFFKGSLIPGKRFMGIFPVFFFYVVLCMFVIVFAMKMA